MAPARREVEVRNNNNAEEVVVVEKWWQSSSSPPSAHILSSRMGVCGGGVGGGGEDHGGQKMYQVAVVGLGMIGSAAARHLSELGSSVVAIGPAEPSKPKWAEHHGPFASHYDQGRLTRISDPDPVWAKLATNSIARYRRLQDATGIRFHYPVGCLRIEHAGSHGLLTSFHVGRQCGASQSKLLTDAAAMNSSFPFFSFRDGDAAIMEGGDAGYINPRSMVAAQLKAAEANGAFIVREAAKEIIPIGSAVKIVTENGKPVWARRVLVCAGSYSSFLLPPASAPASASASGPAPAPGSGGVKPRRRRSVLDLRTYARTVVLAEVDGEEEVERLADMPTFICRPRGNAVLDWVYGCPPIAYPDGRTMIKIGGTAWDAPELGGSESELGAWFRSGGSHEEAAALEEMLLAQLMPGLRVRPGGITTKPCAVSFTAHGRPYIDAVDGDRTAATARVFVAAGGCGAAAKSSDEIGRLAALLVWNGRWGSSDLDPKLFRAVFKPAAGGPGEL